MKHSKTRQPDKPNPLLNLYLGLVAVGEDERASAYRAGRGPMPPHSSRGWRWCDWLRRDSREVWWGRRNRVRRRSQQQTEEKPGPTRKQERGQSGSIYTGSSTVHGRRAPAQPRGAPPGPLSSTPSAPRSPGVGLSEVDPRPRCSKHRGILGCTLSRSGHWEGFPERPGWRSWRSFLWRRPHSALRWCWGCRHFDPAPSLWWHLLLTPPGGRLWAADGGEQSLCKPDQSSTSEQPRPASHSMLNTNNNQQLNNWVEIPLEEFLPKKKKKGIKSSICLSFLMNTGAYLLLSTQWAERLQWLVLTGT